MTATEIGEKLGRSKNSINTRFSRLGLQKITRYTQEEDDFLRNNYQEMTATKISKRLGKSKTSIKNRISFLNLKKDINWTKEEEDFLKDNYKKITAKEIGEKIGRSEVAVRKRFQILGLKVEISSSFTEGEDHFIKSNYKNMSFKEIAEILSRPKGTIVSRARKFGLKKYTEFETDSDTHKTCRSCLQLLPKTEEILGKIVTILIVKNVHLYKAKENKILKQLRTEKEEKEKEKEEFGKSIANNKYTCRKCKEEKLGREMKLKTRNKQ